jgi:hypothetical protein
MRALLGGLFLAVVCSVPLLGQERDRALERIDLRLQQQQSLVRGIDPAESAVPKTFGIFTLVPPIGRGEMIRVAIPIGELVSRAFKGAAAVNRRRQEAAAHRKVEAALEWFKEQQPAPKH